MTVCIAAIAEARMVLAASDRMLTIDDVEYEPKNQTKIIQLTPAIVVMAAGDSSLHELVFQKVWRDAHKRIKEEPENWWLVEDVVDLYRHYYDAERLRQAEAIFLTPLGLTADSFISRQDEMTEEFIKRMENKLLTYETSELQAIICGLDREGTHIYVFANGEISCRDTAGFAAIGAGARHAESQLELAGQSRFSSFAEATILVYTAKKRSEAAPGVGSFTDLLGVGPGIGFSARFAPDRLAKLEAEFQSIRRAEKKAAEKAIARIHIYWEGEIQKLTQGRQQAAASTAEGDATALSSTEP